MEKPVIYTQTIHTPAESRKAGVVIHETDTAGQIVAWRVTYCVEYHNAKAGETEGMLMLIEAMDKDALEAYAMKYEVNLDKRRGVEKLRGEVVSLIEQFGAR